MIIIVLLRLILSIIVYIGMIFFGLRLHIKLINFINPFLLVCIKLLRKPFIKLILVQWRAFLILLDSFKSNHMTILAAFLGVHNWRSTVLVGLDD